MKIGAAGMNSGAESGKRNITLSLPHDLIRESKALAARNAMSLSEFMRSALEKRIREETGYDRAAERQAGLMERGFDLGTRGRISYTREELHERPKK